MATISISNGGLPQNIVVKIAEYLKNTSDKLVAVLCFLADNEAEITKKYTQILSSLINNDEAFRGVVDKLANDTEKLQNDPNYFRIMADIWNYFLKPNMKKNDGDGQRIDFKLVLSDMHLATAAHNFIATISKLHPSVQNAVIDAIIAAAGPVMGTQLALTSLNQAFGDLLQLMKPTTGKVLSVGLVAVYLSIDAWNNLKLWWDGEITKERCLKNIIDSCVGMTAGVCGGIAGAAVGSYIANKVGETVMNTFVAPGSGEAICSMIGAVVVGVTSATLANNLSDWLTQKIFNLPKEAALENAYIFLELKYGASNFEINSNFERLTLKYHPNKGGNHDDWYKLQYSMGIIKLSKEEN